MDAPGEQAPRWLCRCWRCPTSTSRGPERCPSSSGARAPRPTALVELAAGFAGFGDPRSDGLFGTLEECQTQVARLASEGVRDLRCVLPELPDVHDLLAQLPAIVVGHPATHHPGAARSADPPPPPWAGRRER